MSDQPADSVIETVSVSPAAAVAAAGVQQVEVAEVIEADAVTAAVAATEAEIAADAATGAAEAAVSVADVAVTEAVTATDTAVAAEQTAAVTGEAVMAVAADSDQQHTETRTLAQSAHQRLDDLERMLAGKQAAESQPDVEVVPVTEGSSHDSGSRIQRERKHRFGR